MSTPLEFCLNISHGHASLSLKLDEELGTLHGLSYSDFMLLSLLAMAKDGRMPMADLMRPLGGRLSTVMRQLLPLEKIGLVQRETEPGAVGRRCVAIRPGGRKLLHGATATAEAVCDELMRTLPADALPGTDRTLRMIRGSDALKL